MKNRLYFVLFIVAICCTACNLEYFPSDELNAEVLLADEGGAEYIVDGCYAMLKDEVEYLGYSSGNAYVRHYFQMAEYPADNTCLSSKTTDPLYEATAYMMTDGLKNVGTLWWIAYKVIYMANTVIETLNENLNTQADQLLGEAYYLRALMHLHMVTLYAKPYAQGRDNMGVVLRKSTDTSVTTRATVGQCYDQIVTDLKKAASLMKPSSVRGNKGYANHDAALGLLSRVYLYMGQDDDVITTVNELLSGADPFSKLDTDFANYFINARTSQETLFCVAHEANETKGQSSIGSMYLNDGMGWGEIYPSDPLLNLYERYPMDVRYTAFIRPQYQNNATAYNVSFPISNNDDASGRSNLIFQVTKEGDNWTFTDEGTKYTVQTRLVNNEYPEYFVNYNGEERAARVTLAMKNRYNCPMYYITKFSYQNGDPMLSSPVMQRWAEVILNRAEAYAHKGQNADALDDVNVIRTRAGIPEEGLFAVDKMHGYTSVIDVVLDERRLELAFEGHRMFDVYRNNLEMDRRYAGAQPWEIVKPTDNRIQYPIPYSEHSVSGIPQNPGY